MTRTLVRLDSGDDVLVAATKLRHADGSGDLVLVAPEDTPALANPLFLVALRDERHDRPLVLVTPDERARAMASGCRVPAYASVAAYEERSVDPTEQLERARVAALARVRRERREISRRTLRRLAAVGVAALAVAALALPSAEVVVALDAVAVGPLEMEVRVVPGGEVEAQRLSAKVNAKVQAQATGARTDATKATGVVRIQNVSTDTVTIPVGTIVSTTFGVEFRTLEARTLRPSSFFPFLVTETTTPIEAVVPGRAGNVPRGNISRIGDRRLRVANDQPTSGGDEVRVPIVLQADYDGAVAKLDQELKAQGDGQGQRWRGETRAGQRLEEPLHLLRLSRTPANAVVGKEMATFELAAEGELVGYVVPRDEPLATIFKRIEAERRAGYEIPRDTVTYEVQPETTADALVWRITARATQRPRFDEGAVRFSLLARDRESARGLLAERGMRVVGIRSFPEWWPRLPLFPPRIVVRSLAAAP